MKKLALVSLALLSGFAPVAVSAQTVSPSASAPKKIEETCPCSDYRFVAKTEKAKAVAEYWKAKRKVKSATWIGTFALFGAILSQRPTQTLNEAQDGLGQAEGEMESARSRAQSLGGLKVTGTGDDVQVTFTLQKGVDYTLDGK